MNSKSLSDWLSVLSIEERIRALALIFADLTVSARALFVPELAHNASAEAILGKLKGLNELHHHISGQLVGYANNPAKAYPVDVFSNLIFETASGYNVSSFLNAAIEFAQSREWVPNEGKRLS
jgi:hypothetical protein